MALQVLRSMSFSVYSKIAKKHKFVSLGQTMTGFGPIADNAALTRSEVSNTYINLPPYILAPTMNDLVNVDGNVLEDTSRVLFCAYCLSEDQRWLLASIVRDNGEVSSSLSLCTAEAGGSLGVRLGSRPAMGPGCVICVFWSEC